MSILKELLAEIATAGSVSAGAIATTPNSLFGGGVIDLTNNKRKNKHLIRRAGSIDATASYLQPPRQSVTWYVIEESTEEKFDQTDVISKLSTAEKKSKFADKDTVPFGLEDAEGNVVKVYVSSDQAEEFEKSLAALLDNIDDDDDGDDKPDEPTSMEIAEVLFKLKDKFDIVNVDWGTIEEDEEEEGEQVENNDSTDSDSDDSGKKSSDKEMNADAQDTEQDTDNSSDDESSNDDLSTDSSSSDEEDAKSILQQVIDSMKADAEAKEAEARAREAEAKAKEAEYVAQAAAAKVKQEEQTLDMEAYYKEKQEKEKEAKRLAKLAKWKHETASDAETKLSTEMESFAQFLRK